MTFIFVVGFILFVVILLLAHKPRSKRVLPTKKKAVGLEDVETCLKRFEEK